jgi:intracellular sulfur oxidation DsrE/DsrF family protein
MLIPTAGAAEAPKQDGITVDVPVALESASVVFNMDRPAFAGDQPVGLQYMDIMTERFGEDGTEARIVAIFHGAFGYMLLGDKAYDRVRDWKGGNPYRDEIEALMAKGVEIEECAQTMRDHGWKNADLLPGVKVNTGANFRIVQLVQEGFVQLQP